ncbi:hypothetical protein LTR95_009259 [Oleoguttula sp. CCFEE 5521]
MSHDYHTNAAAASMLALGDLGNTPSYSGSGSQAGSEYSFPNPNSPSIDMLLNNAAAASLPNRFTNQSLPDHRSNLPAHNYGGAYDTSSRNAGLNSQSEPLLPVQDGMSANLQHRHRHSLSSQAPSTSYERHNSLGGQGLDEASHVGQSHQLTEGYGENSAGSNSNETLTSQQQGERLDENLPAPTWSELKTKAGKERKRLPLACIACRRKKIRCSGEKPACKHCLRSRIPCVYKVTTRKAAPRTDYMAMLDKRLKRMEDRVIKIIPREDQARISSTGRSNVKPPLPPALPKPSASSKKRGADAAFTGELNEWAGAESKPTESRQDVQAEAARSPIRPIEADEHDLLHEGADHLPPKDIQQHLSEVFFENVYGQSYHLLHKPSFVRKLALGRVPPVLMLAVCAVSARYSTHPQLRTEPAFLRGEEWAKPAREISLKRYDTPNITVLIVFLILGLHEFGTCQGGRSWMFGGMAQRMAYALQLHQDLDHDPKRSAGDGSSELTFTDREIRRRTMWSCFLMDRFSSSGTDRPLFVAPNHIHAQLPIKERLFQLEITGPTEDLQGNVPNPVDPETGQAVDAKENMGVAAYTIRLVAIWGDLISYMNFGGKQREALPMWSEDSTYQKLKRATAAIMESLPSFLEYTEENLATYVSDRLANQFIFMHIIHNQIVLFVNRFALSTPGTRAGLPKDMPESFIAESAQAAQNAANTISALVKEGQDHMVVAPFAGYAAFLSSTVHINGAFSRDPALQASSKQNLAWNVKYLTMMKNYWGMFHFMTENLRDLYRKHADAARSGATTRAGKDGEVIFQYGDWFDRYPHGVSGTDYEEPLAEIKKDPGADAVLGQQSDLQTVEEFFSKLSPPSRAAAQTQVRSRKAAKKSRSKSESKGALDAKPQNLDATNQGSEMLQQQQTLAMQMPDNAMSDHGLPDDMAFTQQQQAFPANPYQAPNSLYMHPQQGVMSQLDRQMVLSSYAGIDPNAPMLDPHQQNNLDFDFSTMAANSNHGQGQYWGDPSSAWFMPFNMEPPTMAEDGNLFKTGVFDWNNGFGEFGPLPPTGLTPRPGLDTGQGASSDGMMDGLDALGRSMS